MKRVNPFDWNNAFPDAMNSGGFDCIIGNPPYVRIQVMKEWAPLEVEIYKELFSISEGRELRPLCRLRGARFTTPRSRRPARIHLPAQVFQRAIWRAVAPIIAGGKHLSHVVHFDAQQVFDGATTYTCLLFLNASPTSKCRIAKVTDLPKWRAAGTAVEGIAKSDEITSRRMAFVGWPRNRVVQATVRNAPQNGRRCRYFRRPSDKRR